MTDIVVIDASVAVSLVVQEAQTDMAERLLHGASVASQQVCAPPHFLGEVINGIYQKVRSTDPARHIDAAAAQPAIRTLLDLPIDILTPAGLYERAYDLARAHELPSLYDGLYVALAARVGGELWTADRRLLQALGGQLPYVRWLGDYPAAGVRP